MSMQDFNNERTFVMIKPDGVQKQIIGEVISRFERCGLKVIALKMFTPTREQMHNHYPQDDVWKSRLGEKTLGTYEKYGVDPKEELGTNDKLEIGEMVRGWVLDYMISAPVVQMIIEGGHAIDLVRKLGGATLPVFADCGTIRGDYSVDSPAIANKEKRAVKNIMHASETPEEAENEIKLWFNENEINTY